MPENTRETPKKGGAITKIVILVVIIALIGGVWLLKSSERAAAETGPQAAGANDEGEGMTADTVGTEPTETPNPDFLLAATGIDLDALKAYGLPIMIDFGADSCIPCKEMAPVLKSLNSEYQGKVIVKFVDVWKNTNGADGFPVQVIPTQFFFDAEGNPYVPEDPEAMQMTMYLLQETEEHVYTAHQGGMTEEQIKTVFKEMGVE